MWAESIFEKLCCLVQVLLSLWSFIQWPLKITTELNKKTYYHCPKFQSLQCPSCHRNKIWALAIHKYSYNWLQGCCSGLPNYLLPHMPWTQSINLFHRSPLGSRQSAKQPSYTEVVWCHPGNRVQQDFYTFITFNITFNFSHQPFFLGIKSMYHNFIFSCFTQKVQKGLGR